MIDILWPFFLGFIGGAMYVISKKLWKEWRNK